MIFYSAKIKGWPVCIDGPNLKSLKRYAKKYAKDYLDLSIGKKIELVGVTKHIEYDRKLKSIKLII